MFQQASCQLTPCLRLVRVARTFTSTTLEALGCPPDTVADCVTVVSELVANAIEAETKDAPGMSPDELPLIGVRLEVTDESVMMVVSDSSPGDLVEYQPSLDDERHRGEKVVAVLCGQAATVRYLPDRTKEVRASMRRHAA